MKATIYKTKEAQVRGEYKETLVDANKSKSDILIESCNGGSYTIDTKGIELTGRGIKHQYQNGFYEVSESMLNKLRTSFNVMTNF